MGRPRRRPSDWWRPPGVSGSNEPHLAKGVDRLAGAKISYPCRPMSKQFDSFSAFYPVYLRMHDHPVNRRLHVVGNLLGLGAIALAIAERRCWILVLAPILANAFAWVGHWYFQRNRPGVFHYPLYGMIGSWRMTWDHFVRRR